MRKLAEKLFEWVGKKLYGDKWPPLLIVVMKGEGPVVIFNEPPRVEH